MNKLNQIQHLINKIRTKNVDLARILELISQDSQITARQRALDGGSSAFGNINESGWYVNFIDIQKYLESNPSLPASEEKSGNTSNSDFTLVASYNAIFPVTAEFYRAKITITVIEVISGPLEIEARLKIGTRLSNVVATSGDGEGWATVTHPASTGTQTVKLEARIASGEGTIKAAVEQQTTSQQGVIHFT